MEVTGGSDLELLNPNHIARPDAAFTLDRTVDTDLGVVMLRYRAQDS